MSAQKKNAEDLVLGMSDAQRAETLSALLEHVPPETLAASVAQVLPRETLAKFLLPQLLDTEQVRQEMSAAARSQGVAREVDQSAVLARVARGTLPTAGQLNRGWIFWRADVERMLGSYNPKIGRPPASSAPREEIEA